MAQVCNSNTWEAEARGPQVPGQLEIFSKTLSQNIMLRSLLGTGKWMLYELMSRWYLFIIPSPYSRNKILKLGEVPHVISLKPLANIAIGKWESEHGDSTGGFLKFKWVEHANDSPDFPYLALSIRKSLQKAQRLGGKQKFGLQF